MTFQLVSFVVHIPSANWLRGSGINEKGNTTEEQGNSTVNKRPYSIHA